MQRQPFDPKFQYSLIFQLRKWGKHQESHTSALQAEELSDVTDT